MIIKLKLIRILKKTAVSILIIMGILTLSTMLYMGQSKFGKNPTGARLERIKKSPNYKDGQFQNLRYTPQLAENHTFPKIIYDRFFKKHLRLKPTDRIPSIQTDLHQLDPAQNVLVWFGHSSYFIQIDGIRILVDPVFSGNASPIPNTVKAFEGSNTYSASDFPAIDYLLISHDHYDHVDHETLLALKDKVKQVICGLGVGSHFEYWGYDPKQIIEKDWYDSVEIKKDVTVFVEPARHFSGRNFKRNKTLWVSFVIQTPSLNMYLGGDSGYDTHYAAIGRKHGPFDLAILENGQYNKAWPYIHETPEEVLKAAQDLRAKRILPVHSSKFTLSTHAWDDPLIELTKLNQAYKFPLVTPIIGEVVNLDDSNQKFKPWWEGLN